MNSCKKRNGPMVPIKHGELCLMGVATTTIISNTLPPAPRSNFILLTLLSEFSGRSYRLILDLSAQKYFRNNPSTARAPSLKIIQKLLYSFTAARPSFIDGGRCCLSIGFKCVLTHSRARLQQRQQHGEQTRRHNRLRDLIARRSAAT